MEDIIIKCQFCGATFTFTESEQRFYESKGFTNLPKRCEKCRRERKKMFETRENYEKCKD